MDKWKGLAQPRLKGKFGLQWTDLRSGETSAKLRNVKEENCWFCFLATLLRSSQGILEQTIPFHLLAATEGLEQTSFILR